MKPIFLLFFFLGLLPLLAAPLSPSEYEKLQQAAPEILQVEVLKVERQLGKEAKEEFIRATVVVLQVEKSASNAKVGDFLFLNYSIRQDFEGNPLPGQIPLLKVGEKLPAFLALEEGTNHYTPVAGLMSFSHF